MNSSTAQFLAHKPFCFVNWWFHCIIVKIFESVIQQTQKSFPGLLATGTCEKQPPARIRFLRFAYASCICSNFNWLLSLRKRRRKRKKIRRKGKKEGDWGERVRDACYNNPPLFTSADAGVRKFLIGSLPFSLSCFPPRPPPFFAPATQATDSLVCLHHLWLARVRVLVYARSFMARMPYTCLAIVSCLCLFSGDKHSWGKKSALFLEM